MSTPGLLQCLATLAVLLESLLLLINNAAAWDIESENLFFQDDILYSENLLEMNAATSKRFRWPNNTVYYYIDENMYKCDVINEANSSVLCIAPGHPSPVYIKTNSSEESKSANVYMTKHQKELIRNALKTFKMHTCVKMIEVPKVSPAPYFVFIRKAVGCYSDVGCLRRKYGQRMSLGSGCLNPTYVRHEFMHSLGFQHEQNRPDRDNYVRIFFDNIQPRYNGSYQILDVDTLGEPYDYNSIVHYKKFQCAIDPTRPTMVSKMDPFQEFGNDDISPIDIRKINKFYECP